LFDRRGDGLNVHNYEIAGQIFNRDSQSTVSVVDDFAVGGRDKLPKHVNFSGRSGKLGKVQDD